MICIKQILVLLCWLACSIPVLSRDSAPIVRIDHDIPGAFPLVSGAVTADILTDPADFKVVSIAAQCLTADIEQITGRKPDIVGKPASPHAVIIGTVGNSRIIDSLIASRQIDVRHIRGKWESFIITTVRNPVPGIAQAIVIAGSDRRGTAFGVFDLSETIGVSPWSWWADVTPPHRDSLYLKPGIASHGPPAVKYRGVFLNDEDWGLQPWAAKTFEPDAGTVGPKTYARIFELMLRLRANTLWPAMHECTTPFHLVPGNNAVADDYAIVLGSSHAEPMLRNNVGEWTAPKQNYNYLTHRDQVLGYWEERVRQRSAGESLFTLGMRGIHDSPIVGPKNQKERIKTLESIFKDQDNLLNKHLGTGTSRIFCPYKEVLADYEAGLKIPDDVTLVWPDDNFGYIRHFPTPMEQQRPGGSGVYYHLSYLGSPLSWLWFDSLPPALIWSEMHKAYELGARTFWIANVGDLKGNELSTEYFLRLAWNADTYGPDSGQRFLKQAAARDFGAPNADAIADLWARHQALAFARKPEHLQWHIPLTPYQPSTLTTDEITSRLSAYDMLASDAAKICQTLPQDSTFQLITYPIDSARAANQRYFQLELARREPAAAAQHIEAATAADREIATLTRRYNEDISNGKWRGIMTAGGVSPRDWLRFQPDPFSNQLKAITTNRDIPAPAYPAALHPPTSTQVWSSINS